MITLKKIFRKFRKYFTLLNFKILVGYVWENFIEIIASAREWIIDGNKMAYFPIYPAIVIFNYINNLTEDFLHFLRFSLPAAFKLRT